MIPAVSSLVRNNHPLVKPLYFEEKLSTMAEIELLWAVYYALPNTSPRLERTKAATKRLWNRKRQHVLPPRKAFETTVDYYEAFLPLFQAKQRFIKVGQVDNCLRSVQKALASILPDKLF